MWLCIDRAICGGIWHHVYVGKNTARLQSSGGGLSGSDVLVDVFVFSLFCFIYDIAL